MRLSDVFSKELILKDGNFDVLSTALSFEYFHNEKILTFIEKEEYIDKLSPNVTCIICKSEFAVFLSQYALVISEDPHHTFFELHNKMCHNNLYQIPIQKSQIGCNTRINKLAFISEYNVIIGNNVIIEEFVSIKSNVCIGDNSVIKAGSVIGGDGFEMKRKGDIIYPIVHLGKVDIGKDVEIQYNCCVDKAVFPWDKTSIGDYTKLDNFVHVAHACKIGTRNLIAAGAILSGTVTTGNDIWIGPGVTISHGVKINDGSQVVLGSTVFYNVPEKKKYMGYGAISMEQYARLQYKLKKL